MKTVKRACVQPLSPRREKNLVLQPADEGKWGALDGVSVGGVRMSLVKPNQGHNSSMLRYR